MQIGGVVYVDEAQEGGVEVHLRLEAREGREVVPVFRAKLTVSPTRIGSLDVRSKETVAASAVAAETRRPRAATAGRMCRMNMMSFPC